jgi:hypothetical protein
MIVFKRQYQGVKIDVLRGRMPSCGDWAGPRGLV